MPGLRCDCCGDWTVPFGGEDTCECGGRCPDCMACPDDDHAADCARGRDDSDGGR